MSPNGSILTFAQPFASAFWLMIVRLQDRQHELRAHAEAENEILNAGYTAQIRARLRICPQQFRFIRVQFSPQFFFASRDLRDRPVVFRAAPDRSIDRREAPAVNVFKDFSHTLHLQSCGSKALNATNVKPY